MTNPWRCLSSLILQTIKVDLCSSNCHNLSRLTFLIKKWKENILEEVEEVIVYWVTYMSYMDPDSLTCRFCLIPSCVSYNHECKYIIRQQNTEMSRKNWKLMKVIGSVAIYACEYESHNCAHNFQSIYDYFRFTLSVQNVCVCYFGN
jgi:hypothetical protein